jgi:hypothetical protein
MPTRIVVCPRRVPTSFVHRQAAGEPENNGMRGAVSSSCPQWGVWPTGGALDIPNLPQNDC